MAFSRCYTALVIWICIFAWPANGNVIKETEVTTESTVTTDPLEDLRRSLENIQKLLGDSPEVRLSNFTSWEQSTQISHILVSSPKNVNEIKRLIKAVKTENLRIRCANRGLSFSSLFPDEYQFLIDTSDLRTRDNGPPMELDLSDSKNPKVIVAGGFNQGDLIEFLLDNNLQVTNLAVIADISLVGSMSTASHADNIRHASFNQYITSIKLVDGDGEIREFNSEDNPDEMETVKSCVGMCGVIYELTIKVEPLYGVTMTDKWEELNKTFRNVTYLREMHNQGSIHYYVAPLSSLTYEQWMQYANTGIIPEEYDPWNDIARVRTMVRKDDFNTSVCKFEMESNQPLDGKNMKNNDNDELIVRSEEDVKHQGTANSEPELFRHWRWYNETRAATEDVKDDCLPVQQGGSRLPELIRDLEYVIPDDENFSNTLRIVEMMLQDLKNRVTGPSPHVPYINFYFRWNAREENCLLCTGNIEAARHIIHMSIQCTLDIPAVQCQNYINELFGRLQEGYPDLRLHWGKHFEYVTGLPEQMRKSYGANLVRFMQRRDRLGLDKDEIFRTKFLDKIFYL